MARIVYATALITLVAIFAGCQPANDVYRVPGPERPSNPYFRPGATETDLVEEMAISRAAYEKGLEQLVGYYSRTGNNMKLDMARKELSSHKRMLKYKYIIGPTASDLQATDPVVAADDLFYATQRLQREATLLGPLGDKNKLRLALQKYEQLIRDYPSSDKVDDSAFQAGVILEAFGEYVLALEYYKSAFKWDPEIREPARFKAAYILDKHMHRYAEALVLYQEALKTEALFDQHRQWKVYAEGRIRELEKLGEGQN